MSKQKGITIEELEQYYGDLLQLWCGGMTFDQGIKQEQKKEYFRKIFLSLMKHFIAKMSLQSRGDLDGTEIAVFFMDYIEGFTKEEKIVRQAEVMKRLMPVPQPPKQQVPATHNQSVVQGMVGSQGQPHHVNHPIDQRRQTDSKAALIKKLVQFLDSPEEYQYLFRKGSLK